MWAISAEKGTTVWKHEQRVGVMSLAATGGGLVFGGDVAGNFRAFDDTTGEVLWETNIGAPVSGYPVSFAVDGKQYVAVTTGAVARRGGVAARDARAARASRRRRKSSCSRCRKRVEESVMRRSPLCVAADGLRGRDGRCAQAPNPNVERHIAAARAAAGEHAAMVDRLCPAPGAARPVQGNRARAAAPRRRASRGTPSPRRCSTISTSSA